MTTPERIQLDFQKAMKARDALQVSTLRMLLSSLHNEKIARRQELSEDEVLAVVRREVKRRNEARESYDSAGRADLAEQEAKERDVLLAYLPEQMSEEAVRAAVQPIIEAMQPSGPKDFGRVMGAVMQELKGKAEGKVVTEIVKQELAARTAA